MVFNSANSLCKIAVFPLILRQIWDELETTKNGGYSLPLFSALYLRK